MAAVQDLFLAIPLSVLADRRSANGDSSKLGRVGQPQRAAAAFCYQMLDVKKIIINND